MKFCFNLPEHFQRLVFSPEAMASLASLVDLQPQAPATLPPQWLRAQAADCDRVICGWGSLPLDAALLESTACR